MFLDDYGYALEYGMRLSQHKFEKRYKSIIFDLNEIPDIPIRYVKYINAFKHNQLTQNITIKDGLITTGKFPAYVIINLIDNQNIIFNNNIMLKDVILKVLPDWKSLCS